MVARIRSVARRTSARPIRSTVPPLEPGDHLDQKTFHERYEAMPEGTRAELIEGIVYMPSPAKVGHGEHHNSGSLWLGHYKQATPGVRALSGASAILGEESEPMPDGLLVIMPDYGGQTRIDADDYLLGPPELALEIALSTESIDLNAKKRDYERAGVLEYIVVALRQQRVYWFVRRRGRFKEMPPDRNGIHHSEAFPGLWLDDDALLTGDDRGLLKVLEQGLASPEHAAFVKKLAARKGTKH